MQVEQYYSDDYAGLISGKYSFYYGYEEVDDNDEWLFTVKENNNVIYQLSTTEIHKMCYNNNLSSPTSYLMFGIGVWLLLKK